MNACTITGSMKVTVLNAFGSQWNVDILPEMTVEKLKLMALSHFYNPVDSVKSAHLYKLVSVTQGRQISDHRSVRQENLQENDELLLLKKRLPFSNKSESAEEKEQKSRGPTSEMIQDATANVEPKHFNRKSEDTSFVVDFHTELRKILVSLILVSEKLLRYQPEILDILNTPVEPESEPTTIVDPESLKQLTDMGFPREKAARALRMNKMSSVEAMDWLLAHTMDLSGSTGTSTESDGKDSAEPGPSSSVLSPKAPVSQPPKSNEASHEMPVIVTILKKFRTYKRKEFRPNRKAVNNLKDMGFSETEIVDSLRINGNNQEAACEWLLGDRRPTAQDLETGLDLDGPIYKAIMSSPVIQLGLCNPKTFKAFLHMLENPTSTSRWLSDPDTAPILSQIFRIYHAEKHSLQLSRTFHA